MDKEFLIYQNVILKYYLIDQYLYLLKDNDNSWESYFNLDSNRYVDILNEDNVIKRIYFDSIKVLTNHELRLRIKYGVIFENNEVFNKIIFSNILINRYFINLVKETDNVPYYILDKKFVYNNKELQIKIYINSFKYIDNNCINDLVFEIIFDDYINTDEVFNVYNKIYDIFKLLCHTSINTFTKIKLYNNDKNIGLLEINGINEIDYCLENKELELFDLSKIITYSLYHDSIIFTKYLSINYCDYINITEERNELIMNQLYKIMKKFSKNTIVELYDKEVMNCLKNIFNNKSFSIYLKSAMLYKGESVIDINVLKIIENVILIYILRLANYDYEEILLITKHSCL